MKYCHISSQIRKTQIIFLHTWSLNQDEVTATNVALHGEKHMK